MKNHYITYLCCAFFVFILSNTILLAKAQQDNDNYLFYLLDDGRERGMNNSTQQSITSDVGDDDVIYQVVESMPEFPGGQQALFKYLSENVKFPSIAKENGIRGRVICQFVVNKDGSIVDVEVVRSGGDTSIDKEAIRVIKSMPKWKPAKQRGKAVRVRYSVPINFK